MPLANNMIDPQTDPVPDKVQSGALALGDASEPLLTTDKLVKQYRHRRVVDGVSICVAAGEIVGLLGPNGAGKTTTFNMVVGVVKPEAGQVRFQNAPITRLPMHKRARLGIGYLTQGKLPFSANSRFGRIFWPSLKPAA